MITVDVALPDGRGYPVLVGDGALDGLAARRHCRVAVLRYLPVELLQVLDKSLLRLHAVD